MPRVIWKGTLSSSLIHIPVSLYAASRSAAPDFDMLDKNDFAPIGDQRINNGTGKPADWGDIGELLRRSLAQRHSRGAAATPARRAELAATPTRGPATTGNRRRRRA